MKSFPNEKFFFLQSSRPPTIYSTMSKLHELCESCCRNPVESFE